MNETVPPHKCAVFLACPGSCGEVPQYPVQISADGSRVVSQCASLGGFTGELCSNCENNHYRGIDGSCQSCSSHTDELIRAIGVIVTAALLLIGFALVVALAPERKLHQIGQIVQWVQMTVMLGGFIVPRVGVAWITAVFNFAVIVNFSLESLQPGCSSVGEVSVFGYFWATIGLNLSAIVICVLSALAYGWRLPAQRLLQQGYSRQKALLRRLIYALSMLLCVQYYQLAFRSVSLVNCISITQGQLVLAIQPSVECYKGEHLPAVIVAWAVLLMLLVFPAWGVFSLTRAPKGDAIPVRLQFLVRDLKKSFTWLPLVDLWVSALLITMWVFSRSATLLVLLALVCLCAFVCFVAIAWPFQIAQQNVLFVVTRAVTVALLLLVLAVFDSEEDFVVNSTIVFYVCAGVGAVSLCLVTIARFLACWKRPDKDGFVALSSDESELHAMMTPVNVQFLNFDANDEF